MKILCNNCGQRFDSILCGNICPHCGRHNELPDQPQGQDAGQPQPMAPQPAPESNVPVRVVPLQPGKGRGWLWAGLLCVVLVFVLMGEFIYFSVKSVRDQNALQKEEITIPITSHTMATQYEPFEFGTYNRSVTVGTAERFDGARGVDPDAMFVRVWLDVGKQSSYTSGQNIETYLEVDGSYYSALYSGSLARVYPELEEDVLVIDDLVSRHMNEGWLYFVAPKDASTVTLWLQTQHLNDDYNASSIEMLGVTISLEQGVLE